VRFNSLFLNSNSRFTDTRFGAGLPLLAVNIDLRRRFAILPKVASVRNADVKSHLDRFRVHCTRDRKLS
jgi:hypothetical protein